MLILTEKHSAATRRNQPNHQIKPKSYHVVPGIVLFMYATYDTSSKAREPVLLVLRKSVRTSRAREKTREAHLDETDSAGILTEALTADVHTVFLVKKCDERVHILEQAYLHGLNLGRSCHRHDSYESLYRRFLGVSTKRWNEP